MSGGCEKLELLLVWQDKHGLQNYENGQFHTDNMLGKNWLIPSRMHLKPKQVAFSYIAYCEVVNRLILSQTHVRWPDLSLVSSFKDVSMCKLMLLIGMKLFHHYSVTVQYSVWKLC